MECVRLIGAISKFLRFPQTDHLGTETKPGRRRALSRFLATKLRSIYARGKLTKIGCCLGWLHQKKPLHLGGKP